MSDKTKKYEPLRNEITRIEKYANVLVGNIHSTEFIVDTLDK